MGTSSRQKFDEIQLKAANSISTNIEYGDAEAVWIRKRAKNMIQVTQNGNTLIIDLAKKAKAENYTRYELSVVIITPKPRLISTGAFTFVEEKSEGKPGNVSRNYGDTKTSVTGFALDSLRLNVGPFTMVKLTYNSLKSLTAKIGENNNEEASLVLSDNNKIESVNLKVKGKSSVDILDADIQNFQNEISDSASVKFRGVSLKQISRK